VNTYMGMPVITAENSHEFVQESVNRGYNSSYIPRDYSKQPFASSYAAPAASIKIPPRSQWSALIKAQQANESSLYHQIQYGGLTVLDQQQTNYCWCNGVVYAVMAMMLRSHMRNVRLSPASLAAIIKNFQNVGGWGLQAIEGSIEHGICSQEFWPANAIDRQYDNTKSRADRKQYAAFEYSDIRPGDFDTVAAYLLAGIPVPIGHAWWGHLVCHVALVEVSPGKFGTIFANSWGEDYGQKGFGVMVEAKARPDEANAVIAAKLAA